MHEVIPQSWGESGFVQASPPLSLCDGTTICWERTCGASMPVSFPPSGPASGDAPPLTAFVKSSAAPLNASPTPLKASPTPSASPTAPSAAPTAPPAGPLLFHDTLAPFGPIAPVKPGFGPPTLVQAFAKAGPATILHAPQAIVVMAPATTSAAPTWKEEKKLLTAFVTAVAALDIASLTAAKKLFSAGNGFASGSLAKGSLLGSAYGFEAGSERNGSLPELSLLLSAAYTVGTGR